MKRTLVVVDDAPFIQEVVREICSKSNIEVIGDAEDGEEAIRVIRAKKPDVVLMDIVMPKKSGIEATKEILEFMPELKIIACSTIDSENVIMNAIEAGCCDYIIKPFRGEDLIKSINKVFEEESS